MCAHVSLQTLTLVTIDVSDSVDTRTALDAIRELVSSSNVYIGVYRKSEAAANRLLLKKIATYITGMLKVGLRLVGTYIYVYCGK